MSETTTPRPGFEAERDDETFGLSLSELLGEVWAPVGRPAPADDDPASGSLAPDPDSGDPSAWNL